MSGRIRVLMVLGNTRMGGVQAFILNFLSHLDNSRFQVDLAINYEGDGGVSDEFRSYGCNIYILPYFKVYNYCRFCAEWKAFLKTHHYDIIHGHSSNSASIYLGIAKKMGCVTIAHSHNGGYRGNKIQQIAKKFFVRKVGNVAEYWFACSDVAAQRLFGDSYKTYDKYFRIPNAIDSAKYRYSEKTAQDIRERLGVAKDVLLCGHVGTFSQQKNHSFLLEIFSELHKINPRAMMVLCGEGEMLSIVYEKARQKRLLDSIIFTGVVKNVHEFMMAMDVLVFPSLHEGFPFSVIEAEATGLPVVMSDSITAEVDLTDIVYRISLSESASDWANKILCVKRPNRIHYNELIAHSEYDLVHLEDVLSSLYERMVPKE